MSFWWIGVKGSEFAVFEATAAEAMSEDFESVYGVAFGSYRSKEQAESDMKKHQAHLINEAKNVLVNRANEAEKPLKTPKPAELTEDAVWEGPDDPFSVFLVELNELKVKIIRTIEAGIVLKRYIEEKSENKDKEA